MRSFDSPLEAARTNTGPAALLWFFFPHNVNYHIEHHLHPTIPHYNLPAAHEAFLEHGLLGGAEVCDLRDTVRLAFSTPAPGEFPSPWR